MVFDATGAIAPVIELHDQAAKNRGGRRIPVHPDLYIVKPIARLAWKAARPIPAEGRSSRGQPGWSTGQGARCAMCRYWQVIGPW
jgi:hypothetical protein